MNILYALNVKIAILEVLMNIEMRLMTNLTRIKRVIIITLILMTIFTFVAVINLHTRLEGYIEAQDILIEYNERSR